MGVIGVVEWMWWCACTCAHILLAERHSMICRPCQISAGLRTYMKASTVPYPSMCRFQIACMGVGVCRVIREGGGAEYGSTAERSELPSARVSIAEREGGQAPETPSHSQQLTRNSTKKTYACAGCTRFWITSSNDSVRGEATRAMTAVFRAQASTVVRPRAVSVHTLLQSV